MDRPILITGEDCQKCIWLKNKIAKEELDVEIVDRDSTEAMGHLAYHEMLHKMPLDLPILIFADEQFFAGENINSLKILREFKENKKNEK